MRLALSGVVGAGVGVGDAGVTGVAGAGDDFWLPGLTSGALAAGTMIGPQTRSGGAEVVFAAAMASGTGLSAEAPPVMTLVVTATVSFLVAAVCDVGADFCCGLEELEESAGAGWGLGRSKQAT